MASLKDRNRFHLICALSIQLLILWAISTGFDLTRNFTWAEAVNKAVPPTGLFAAIGFLTFILQGLFSSTFKTRLVYWNFWGETLPSASSFTKWIYKDSRISPEVFSARYNPLPTFPREQTALWYKIYKKHQNDIGVEDSHRRFLLSRDMAAIWLIVGITGSCFIWILQADVDENILILVVNIIGYAAINVVSRNYGVSFVKNVLACECAHDPEIMGT